MPCHDPVSLGSIDKREREEGLSCAPSWLTIGQRKTVTTLLIIAISGQFHAFEMTP